MLFVLSNHHCKNGFFLCLCVSDETLWKRFKTNRTDHGKLRARVKKAKSGLGQLRALTQRQIFKLNRYSFLDQYQKPRNETETLGQVI